MVISTEFQEHLGSGITTVCRCWAVVRADGVSYGFTDHDRSLAFEDVDFKADSGLTAKALLQTSGLAVDNSEALGAISDAAITEEDIAAGRFDGAEVRAWLVNWAVLEQRVLQFRGTIGELRRSGGAFQAELRGLTEALNQPQGRVYQKPCTAVLGDKKCRFAFTAPEFATQVPVEGIEDTRIFRFSGLSEYEDRWFEYGRFVVVNGAAAGLFGVIKNDHLNDDGREIELWESIRGKIETGDLVRLEAGCDKRDTTCLAKFDNFLNYRGFPDIPGEDWLMSYPTSSGVNDGGSLN